MKTLAEEKTQQEVEILISEQLLKQSLIDAFDDLLRLTNYHPTDVPNPMLLLREKKNREFLKIKI